MMHAPGDFFAVELLFGGRRNERGDGRYDWRRSLAAVWLETPQLDVDEE